MADPPLRVTEYPALALLPEDARRLLGQDAYSTSGWYRAVTQNALGPGEAACFQCVARDGQVLGLFPMRRAGRKLSSLTTPYTVLWSPLLAPDSAPAVVEGLGLALGRIWRGQAATRLEALDPAAPFLAPFLKGARKAGLAPLRFDHFGNWHENVAGLGYDAYLASRQGELRSSVRRHTKRLMGMPGAAFSLVTGEKGLAEALAQYAQVYGESWKPAEPFPDFNAALMREAAAAGSLRLGILSLAGRPVAAQYWLLHQGWAGVQKLAHVEAQRALAPGTVLTGLMVRHLLEVDRVTALDFGRGDDEYKRLWVGERRQRVGVLLAAPWHAGGALAIARHGAGRLRRRRPS